MNTKAKIEKYPYYKLDAENISRLNKGEKFSKNNEIQHRSSMEQVISEKGVILFSYQSSHSIPTSDTEHIEDSVEKPPSQGLLHIYLIDADDSRRGQVRKLFSGRSNIVIRIYRSRTAFLAEADSLDEGCVVLCDHDEEDGADVATFIRQLGSHQRFACVMLATERDLRAAINAMKAGALDCLLYPCEAEEILACIYGALDTVKLQVAQNAALIEARQQIERLTARERDVLHGLMHGKSNKMIALDLEISPRTVEIYRAHLMEKLGASSLSETLKVAFAAGLG